MIRVAADDYTGPTQSDRSVQQGDVSSRQSAASGTQVAQAPEKAFMVRIRCYRPSGRCPRLIAYVSP